MKNQIIIFLTGILMSSFILMSCDSNPPQPIDNGIYEVNIQFPDGELHPLDPSQYQRKLVRANSPFDIHIIFDPFGDDNKVQHVEVSVYKSSGEFIETLLNENVNSLNSYSFLSSYQTEILGDIIILATTSLADGSQKKEKQMTFHVQEKVGNELKVMIDIDFPPEGQTLPLNEFINFSFSLERMVGLGGVYNAYLTPHDVEWVHNLAGETDKKLSDISSQIAPFSFSEAGNYVLSVRADRLDGSDENWQTVKFRVE